MKKKARYDHEGYAEHENEKVSGKTSGNSLFIPVASVVLGFMIIAIIVVFVFFPVKEVVVEGNIHYTEEEIKKWILNGVTSKNTILASLFKDNRNVTDIEFVESVYVDYVNPNKICITVNEKEVVGYVEENTMCYYFDRDGVIVEESNGPVMTAEERMQLEQDEKNKEAGTEGEDGITAFEEEVPVRNFVPPVRGLRYTIQSGGESSATNEDTADEAEDTAAESENAETEDQDDGKSTDKKTDGEKRLIVENKAVFNTLVSLKQMINKDNIPPEYVYFDEEYNIYLFYDSIEVRLGQDIDLENKMTTLAAIMPKIEGMSGTLLLENYSSIQSGVVFQKKE